MLIKCNKMLTVQYIGIYLPGTGRLTWISMGDARLGH